MTTKLPFKLGLKLWSSNVECIEEAQRAYREGVFDYIELYVVPKTADTIPAWRNASPSFIIHCPHMSHGFNLALADLRGSNKALFSEVRLFADELSADTIIVHSGNGGPLQEAISQYRNLSDPRICVENKPRIGLNGAVCLGTTPQEIGAIMTEGKVGGFVLDFGHAVCAANSLGLELVKLLREFLEFHPRVFHFSDGHYDMEFDTHLNLGEGSFDLADFLGMVPDGARVSLETPRTLEKKIQDFEQDREVLVSLLKEIKK